MNKIDEFKELISIYKKFLALDLINSLNNTGRSELVIYYFLITFGKIIKKDKKDKSGK